MSHVLNVPLFVNVGFQLTVTVTLCSDEGCSTKVIALYLNIKMELVYYSKISSDLMLNSNCIVACMYDFSPLGGDTV